jgi:hypothetical protein
MLALKKKREVEAKAKLAAAAEQQAAGTDAPTDSPGVKKVSISLLGVGGKKNKDNGGSKSNGKRRTPGEIRIQTGKSLKCCIYQYGLFDAMFSRINEYPYMMWGRYFNPPGFFAKLY